MNSNSFIIHTQKWIKTVVIDHHLCPFAAPVWDAGLIRYTLSQARDVGQLWVDFLTELEFLISANRLEVETSLLIHPFVLGSFADYLDFLANADAGLKELKLTGIIQLAGFHPDYNFAGAEPDDAENYTNRSPYPMIHLLREASVSEAVLTYPDTQEIPERNIDHLRKLGLEKVKSLREGSFLDKA